MSLFSRKRKPIDLTYLLSHEAMDDDFVIDGKPVKLFGFETYSHSGEDTEIVLRFRDAETVADHLASVEAARHNPEIRTFVNGLPA